MPARPERLEHVAEGPAWVRDLMQGRRRPDEIGHIQLRRRRRDVDVHSHDPIPHALRSRPLAHDVEHRVVDVDRDDLG
nr:hypothetical protein [Herbiconiux sp.]